MTIKRKLVYGLCMSLAAVSLLIGVAIWSQQKMADAITSLDRELEKMALMTTLQLRINEAIMPANDYIITGDFKYRDEFAKLNRSVEKAYAAIHASTVFSASEREIVANSRNFYTGLHETSTLILSSNHRDPELPALMEKMDYEFAAPAIASIENIRKNIDLTMQNARADAASIKRFTLIVFTSLALAIIGAVVFFSITLIRSIILPINATVNLIRQIAEGNGDMTRRLPVKSNDEMGQLAFWFNRFVEGMQGIVRSIVDTTTEVASVTADLKKTSRSVTGSTRQQMQAVEVTTSSTLQMQSSIQSVVADATALSSLTENAATASAQISTAVNDLANIATDFDSMTDKVAAAVTEIAASTRQVNGSIDSLAARSDAIVSSVTEVEYTLREIRNHSLQQAELAEQTRQIAADDGLNSVTRTRDGMENIRKDVTEAAEVVLHLGEMSSEISRVAAFIREITDVTSLVALNASILAAQAGVHGRGFAVLADEIKGLSRRAAASTDEIAGHINEVVDGVANAVNKIKGSLATVDRGITLSDNARKSLEKIIASSSETLNMARTVEKAVGEQSAGMSQISVSVGDMDQMISQIRIATEEQHKAAVLIESVTLGMNGASQVVRKSLTTQAAEVIVFAKLVTEASQRMEMICRATGEQKLAAESISTAMTTIREQSACHLSLTEELEGLIFVLNKSGAALSMQVQGLHV